MTTASKKRDFIYGKDVVETLYAMLRYGEISGVYNLGTGFARSWNDLAHAVFAALELPPKIEYIEMPTSLRAISIFHRSRYEQIQETRITKPFYIA